MSFKRLDQVRAYARASSGFITTKELAQLQIPSSTARRWAQGGQLVRFQRGVYRVDDGLIGFDEAVDLAAKVMGPDRAISGRSALALWDLPGGSRSKVEVVGPPGATSISKHLICHRSRDLRPSDATLVNGIPVCTPTRALIDGSAALSDQVIGDALVRGRQRSLFSIDEVSIRVAELTRPGRGGLSNIRRVLSTAIEDTESLRPQNGYEQMAQRLFESFGLPKPVAQMRIDSGRQVFYVDFAWPSWRLIVECDSILAHSTQTDLQHDLSRQNALVQAGWRVLRFSYFDIRDRPEHVAAVLRAEFKSAQAI